MDFGIALLIALAAFFTSALTFFSGFGLGTLLLPAFALFYPLPIAVALTAIVHLLNNLFKILLVGRHADKAVLLRFGLPAILASFAGAYLLIFLENLPPLYRWESFGGTHEITLIKLTISILIAAFSLLEIHPAFNALTFERKYLPLGGVLSGFFGGLSGHQGAFRSAFLMKSGLSKESFIGTGVLIAVLIDITRLAVYSSSWSASFIQGNLPILLVGVLSAFAGAYLGNRLLKRLTLQSLQWIVSGMLLLVSVALGAGLI